MIRYAETTLYRCQLAANKLQDGDTLCLCGDLNFNGSLVLDGLKNIIVKGKESSINQKASLTPTIIASKCQDLELTDLDLTGKPDGYDPNQRTDAIGIKLVNGIGDTNICRCRLTNHACSGLTGINTHHVNVSDCDFSAPDVPVQDNEVWNVGLNTYGYCPYWIVHWNRFDQIGIGCIFYSNQNKTHVYGNRFDEIRGQHGMYFNSANNCEVCNNVIHNHYGAGIKFQLNVNETNNFGNIKIHDNQCVNDANREHYGQVGITVYGVGSDAWWKNIKIEDNFASHCAYGVQLKNVDGVVVQDNEIHDAQYGILGYTLQNHDLEDNSFVQCETEIQVT